MAGSKFTEGITLYNKHKSVCEGNKDLMTKITQLYTNRALAWHSLGNQDDALKDSDYVLENLDANNSKALFRRAIAYKSKGQLAKACVDLEKLIKIEPKNPHAKKELLQMKTELKNAPKIQEVDVTPKASSPTKKEDSPASPTKNEDEKESQAKQQVKNKTKMLDAETVEKASERASTEAAEAALKQIPKTVAGLERDFHQLKKDSSHVYQYIKNIPLKTVETIFKRSEVNAEILSGILGAFSSHSQGDNDSKKHAAEFLISLSKSENYDMTLMFVDDSDKATLKKIGDSVKSQKELHKQYNKVYGSL